MKKLTACLALVLAALIAAPALAQHDGGSTGCGDLFGDLIHIKRDAATGQPILAKRWIEYPGIDTSPTKYDWGYCPIALAANGDEIGFVDLSCDPVTPGIAVDYFGRLSAGRTKERNLRMHFDEVIDNIKAAKAVGLDEAGRLKLTFEDAAGVLTTKVVDSPVENISMYHRLMKYGHFGTDPNEVDIWAHPSSIEGQEVVQYHPHLDATDYAKFLAAGLGYLLPADASACFSESGFNSSCARPDYLDQNDLLRAASFLATGADKGGKVTPDLLQYMNRILKITTTTLEKGTTTILSEATLRTIPARIRECETVPSGLVGAVPGILYENCAERDADARDDIFPANELFVDFSPVLYSRTAVWLNQTLDIIRTMDNKSFVVARGVPLFQYLEFKNAGLGSGTSIDGFVKSANDALRSVEFLHNYAVPDDLGWDFKTVTRTK